MAARSAVGALCLALCIAPALAGYSWDTLVNQNSLQSGDVRSPAPDAIYNRRASCRLPDAGVGMLATVIAVDADRLLPLQLTSYGSGNDEAGACSYGSNFANVISGGLPWNTGTTLTVAMNEDQWANSAACGAS